MTLPFQPDPVVLAFLFAKKFVFLEVLVILAAIRLIGGGGLARLPALGTFVLALGGVLTVFAPAAGLNQGPVYVSAARTMGAGAGMTALLVPSALFLISAVMPGVRWRWIDALHVILLAALLGLWWWTS